MARSSAYQETFEDVTEVSAPWELGARSPVVWSAVFVGVFSLLAALAALGLLGTAIGAHQFVPDQSVNWKALGIGAAIYTVFAVFFSYVFGGWIAGRLVGGPAKITSAHGSITWLLSLPAIALMIALGAGSVLGGFGGVIAAGAQVSQQIEQRRQQGDPQAENAARQAGVTAQQAQETARNAVSTLAGADPNTTPPEEVASAAARNGAIVGLCMLLLGFAGGTLGGRAAGNKPAALLPLSFHER